MYKKFFSAMYTFNIVIQSFFSLLTPIGLAVLISWLTVRYLSAPEWIYAPLIVIGALAGLVGMVRFILEAMAGVERLEREQEEKAKAVRRENARKRESEGNDNSEQ